MKGREFQGRKSWIKVYGKEQQQECEKRENGEREEKSNNEPYNFVLL